MVVEMHLDDRQLHRKDRAVRAQGLDLDASAEHATVARGEVPAHALRVSLTQIWWDDQLVDRPAQRLGPAVTEGGFGGPVEFPDAAILVNRDDTIEGSVDNRGMDRLQLPGRTRALGGGARHVAIARTRAGMLRPAGV